MHKYASFQPYSSHSALYFKNECLQLKWKEVREVEPKCFNQKKRKKNGLLQWLPVTILTVWNWAFSHPNSGSLTCCLTFIGNDTRLLLPSIRHQGSETQPFFPTPWLFGEKKYAKLDGADHSIQGGKKNRSSSWEQNLHHNGLFVRLFPASPLPLPRVSWILRWMFIINSPSLSSSWGPVLFLGAAAIRAQLSIKHSNVQAAHSAVCVITVTITDKMTGR